MKFKDYLKVHNESVSQPVKDACERNGIDFNEYRKKDKLLKIISDISCVVLLLAMSVIMACCSPKSSKVTTPVVNEQALNLREPLRAYDNDTLKGYVDIHNKTNDQYVAHDTSYGRNYYINTNETTRVSFTNEVPHKYISVYNPDDDPTVYFVPWNFNYTNSYTAQKTDESFRIDVSTVDFDDLYIMRNYNSKSYYFDLSLIGDISPNTDFTRLILGYQNIDTNGNYLYGNYFLTSSFMPNLKQEYRNIQNDASYNMIQFKYNIKSVGFGYQIDTSIWAVNTGSDASLMLASNRSASSYRINVHGDYVEFEPYSNETVSYLTSYYLAPYLEDTKLTAEGNYFNVTSNNNFTRLLFSEDKSLSFKTAYLYDSSNSEDLWSQFGDLFRLVFISLSSLGSIYILPMVTIGALIIAPLIVGFIILIIKVLRK